MLDQSYCFLDAVFQIFNQKTEGPLVQILVVQANQSTLKVEKWDKNNTENKKGCK